ncbi:MAG: hypothetical protein IPG96_01835 [Proteobacteria bacterium]|nr:hypothetical protein [Pseudomonadota bacterium]
MAAERYGVQVHAVCVLSNHLHLVITDQRGTRPEFCRWLFEFTAKCLNAHWGRWENFWASEPPSVVRLADAEVQLAKVVYTLTNPVAAGLVTEHHLWPGLISRPARVPGSRLSYDRGPARGLFAGGASETMAGWTVQPSTRASALRAWQAVGRGCC